MMRWPWNWHSNRPRRPHPPGGAGCASTALRKKPTAPSKPARLLLADAFPVIIHRLIHRLWGQPQNATGLTPQSNNGLKYWAFLCQAHKPARVARTQPAVIDKLLRLTYAQQPAGTTPPGSQCPSSWRRGRGTSRRTCRCHRLATGRHRSSPSRFPRHRSAWCGQ